MLTSSALTTYMIEGIDDFLPRETIVQSFINDSQPFNCCNANSATFNSTCFLQYKYPYQSVRSSQQSQIRSVSTIRIEIKVREQILFYNYLYFS